jgi:hypothetical protein
MRLRPLEHFPSIFPFMPVQGFMSELQVVLMSLLSRELDCLAALAAI